MPYCQGLIHQVKEMDKSVTDSFHSVLPRDTETSRTTAYDQEFVYCSNSQPFYLIAHINELGKFCSTPQNMYFCHSDEKLGIILVHSHWTAITVLAVDIF